MVAQIGGGVLEEVIVERGDREDAYEREAFDGDLSKRGEGFVVSQAHSDGVDQHVAKIHGV